MTLRSTRPGSAISFRSPTIGVGQLGVIAATGPTAGVLGVYVGTTLAAKVDLRSATAVPRKVVAVLKAPPWPTTIRVVNLTPTARAGAAANFDGLVRIAHFNNGPRSTPNRDVLPPSTSRCWTNTCGNRRVAPGCG